VTGHGPIQAVSLTDVRRPLEANVAGGAAQHAL
jgi:hypothetical protein